MTTLTLMRGDDGKLTGFSERDKRVFGKFKAALEGGQLLTVSMYLPRNPKLHRLHFAVINALFEQQEQFTDEDALRKWCYVGAGHFESHPGPKGKAVAIPKSVAFDKIDDADFADLHQDMLGFMRSNHCTQYLWPHLSHHQQTEMIESVLSQFEETT